MKKLKIFNLIERITIINIEEISAILCIGCTTAYIQYVNHIHISISHTYICARSTHIYTMFVYWLRALLPPSPLDHYRLYSVSRGAYTLSRNLKSRYGARNRFQEPSLELSTKLHRMAGRYENPMPTWFL